MPTSWEQQLRGPMMEGPPLNMDKENQGIYNTRLRAERVMKKPTVLTPTACNSLQPSRDTNSIQKVPDGTCTQQVSESKHKPIEKIFERILKGDGRMSTRTFLKGKFLGKGGFARCYEMLCEDNNVKYAGKIVPKSSLIKPKAKQKFTSEIKIHKSLNHPQIVKFEHFFEDADNSYILLELCKSQSLSDLLRRRKRLSENEVRYYLRQLIEGISYLHHNLVIHRDLKLGNLFLTDDMKLKIGDFGLAARLDSLYDRKKTMCGTPNYIAPEVLQGQEGGGHSFEVDIWSMGVVMYTLLFGKPPFETKEVKDTYKRIRANQYSFPSSVEVSQSAKSLIMDILKTEPTQRPSLDAILAHAFFQDHSVPKFLPKSALIVTPPNKNVLLATKKTSAASISTTKTTTTITTTTTATATIVSSSTTSGRYNITPSSSHHHHHHLHHHHHDQQHQHQHEHHHPEKQQQGQEEYSKDSSSSLSTLHQTYETLHRVFFLREHGERAEKLDEFSNTSTIVAAAKRLKELRLENDARFGGKLVPANLWVSQWVDYTSKYGMGYILSNQCAGVYFNDSTKIIASPNDQKFDYIERHRSWTLENDQDRKHYRMEEYDPSLSKKVTLLTHFRGYLNESRAENVEVAKLEQYFDKNHQFVLSRNEKQPEKPLEYVKKWVKTRHAVLFCLSNGTFQLNFFDSSKLILSNGGRLVTYLDKEGVLDVFSSAVAVLSDDKTDLLKRLRYAKDMLQQLLKSNSSSGSSSNGSTGYTCTGNSNNGGNGNGSSNSGGGKSS